MLQAISLLIAKRSCDVSAHDRPYALPSPAPTLLGGWRDLCRRASRRCATPEVQTSAGALQVTADAPILRFDNVSKHYDQPSGDVLKALDKVSFEISAGKKLAITGRSGSGKSTLLHLAAGIDVPSAGTVSFLGQDLGGLSERERTLIRRDDIGLVFQFFYLLPHLTVWENVALPGWIASDKSFEDRGRELLDRVGLAAHARQAASKLSGGEMQRVAICRALLRKPRLLLAD